MSGEIHLLECLTNPYIYIYRTVNVVIIRKYNVREYVEIGYNLLKYVAGGRILILFFYYQKFSFQGRISRYKMLLMFLNAALHHHETAAVCALG